MHNLKHRPVPPIRVAVELLLVELVLFLLLLRTTAERAVLIMTFGITNNRTFCTNDPADFLVLAPLVMHS
jgi:hypothetical protein